MKNLTHILIENEIKLISDNDYLNITIILPTPNIQKMLETIKGRLISKKIIILDYNHNAGETMEVKVEVLFENAKKYLTFDTLFNADNRKDFLSLLHTDFKSSYNIVNCITNKIKSLYAFGQVTRIFSCPTTIYYYKNGKSIYLNDNPRTNLGKKRYLKNAGKWVSNKAY